MLPPTRHVVFIGWLWVRVCVACCSHVNVGLDALVLTVPLLIFLWWRCLAFQLPMAIYWLYTMWPVGKVLDDDGVWSCILLKFAQLQAVIFPPLLPNLCGRISNALAKDQMDDIISALRRLPTEIDSPEEEEEWNEAWQEDVASPAVPNPCRWVCFLIRSSHSVRLSTAACHAVFFLAGVRSDYPGSGDVSHAVGGERQDLAVPDMRILGCCVSSFGPWSCIQHSSPRQPSCMFVSWPKFAVRTTLRPANLLLCLLMSRYSSLCLLLAPDAQFVANREYNGDISVMRGTLFWEIVFFSAFPIVFIFDLAVTGTSVSIATGPLPACMRPFLVLFVVRSGSLPCSQSLCGCSVCAARRTS